MTIDTDEPINDARDPVPGAHDDGSGIARRFPAVDPSFEWLLERLLVATRQPYEAERVRRAVLACASTGERGFEVIERSAGAVGLRATHHTGTVQSVMETVGSERPVVASTPDGWLLLVDRSGHQVLTERFGQSGAVWMSASEIQQTFGDEPRPLPADDAPTATPAQGAPVFEWLLVDPVAPLAKARADSLAEARGDADHPGEEPTPFRRLMALLRIEREDVATVVIYGAGVGILGLATPVAVQALVNTVAFGTLVQPLVVLVTLLFGGLSFAALLQVLETWVVELLQRRLTVRLVADLAHRLPRVDLSNLGGRYPPEVVNRFFDVFTIQKALAFLLLDGLGIALTALSGMIVLAFYHPYLLAFDVLLVLGVLGIIVVVGRPATRSSLHESKKKYRVEAWFEDVARSPISSKHTGAPDFHRFQAETLTREYLAARDDHFRLVLRQIIAALALQAVASAALLGIGGGLVIARELTIGQLVAAELIVATVVGSLAKLGKHLENYYDLLAAVDKVGQLLDLPMEHQDGEPFIEPVNPAGSRVHLRDLRLVVPGGREVLRVDRLDLDRGECVSLTGASGTGKTHLLESMFGLRATEPGGHMEVDGSDIREVRLDDLRSRVSLVRGPEVVEGTIADNVRLGRPGLPFPEVRAALDAACLGGDLATLPDGIQTRLSSDGAPLSSGQILRLGIARAMVGRPGLLLVDDVLDRLDRGNRRAVFGALRERPQTLLVVSDDPEVHAMSDRVLRVVDGGLVDITPASTPPEAHREAGE